MRRSLRNVLVLSSLLGLGTLAQLASGADAKVEAEAKKLQGDAMDVDFLSADYKNARKKLEEAIKKCGSDKCGGAILGAVQRDLGIVLVNAKDAKGAQKAFEAALTLDGSLTIPKDYASGEVNKSFDAAKKKVGTTAPAVTATVAPSASATSAKPPAVAPDAEGNIVLKSKLAPIGFVLPIVIELPDGLDAEMVKFSYKTAGMEKYKAQDAKKVGEKYITQIDCSDTQFPGDIKAYIRAYDSDKNEIDHFGTIKKPAIIKLVDKMPDDVEAPTFPGGKEPDKCTDKADCQPGFPCDKKKSQGTYCDRDDECEAGLSCVENDNGKMWCYDKTTLDPKGKPKGASKLVIGFDIQPDLMFIGGANDICLDTAWACSRNNVDVGVVNGVGVLRESESAPPGAGKTSGGFAVGTVRVMASLDYFVTPNISIGGRLGFAFNGNPTESAKFLPFHGEIRGQYFFGTFDPKKGGLRPYMLLGGGVGQFDAAVPDLAVIVNPESTSFADKPDDCLAGRATDIATCKATGVKAYRLAGRGFAEAGAGFWYFFTPKLALNLGVKLIFPIPTFSLGLSPEIGLKLAL